MAGGRFELAMEPTAIELVSLNSNSETHMTVDVTGRPIYGPICLKSVGAFLDNLVPGADSCHIHTPEPFLN